MNLYEEKMQRESIIKSEIKFENATANFYEVYNDKIPQTQSSTCLCI